MVRKLLILGENSNLLTNMSYRRLGPSPKILSRLVQGFPIASYSVDLKHWQALVRLPDAQKLVFTGQGDESVCFALKSVPAEPKQLVRNGKSTPSTFGLATVVLFRRARKAAQSARRLSFPPAKRSISVSVK